MDTASEMSRLKWLFVVAVLLIMSGYFSWVEMKYMAFGKSADANLVRVYETTERGRRGRQIEKQVVEYRFHDSAGVERTESDKISANDPTPAGPTVPIEYVDNSPGDSRLAGHTNTFWVFLFAGCLAYLGYKVVRIFREAKA